ncbi:MAG: ATP-binding protein [Pseudomonadota bacterium]|nr:ATP-binding protein [Pseudomonadota bacterium]
MPKDIMSSKSVTLIIDSRLESTGLVGTAIRGICGLTRLDQREIGRMELCTVEAVTNSIKHAYGLNAGSPVRVEVTLAKERLDIRVCDQGNPMPAGALRSGTDEFDPNPDDPSTFLTGGMGLPLILDCMDIVTYRSESGWNCLTMTKNYDLR